MFHAPNVSLYKLKIMNKTVLFSLLLISALACKRQTNPDNGSGTHTHQHDELGSAYTLFSETLEFYVQHPALLAGEETEILVHLTRTDSYMPCSEGNVSIRMDGVSVTSGKAKSPGIFKVPFIPKTGGAFHAQISYKEGSLEEGVEAHVHVYADHAAMHEPGEDSHGHSHPPAPIGEITFSKEQAWEGDFRVEMVRRGPFLQVVN